ncbi:ATP-binding protein [Halomonas sp. SCS19]|uniref:ATP-binding protein n=1 Tax=Halomonas sp. SCS19 TaxID=2950870 RepID=UPI0032DFD142
MRRALADSTFLRVYVMLAATLVLALGVAMVGMTLIDKVRIEHYREQLAEAPMHLLATMIDSMPRGERREWMAEKSEALDMSMSIVPLSSLSPSYFTRLRLQRGGVLVGRDSPHEWRFWRLMPAGGAVLQVSLSGMSERQLRGLTQLSGEWLASLPAGARQASIDSMTRGDLPVSISQSPPDILEPRQRNRLAGGEVMMQLLPEHWSVVLFMQVTPPGEAPFWLTVGPMASYEALPPALLASMLVLLMGALAIVIYLIVRGIEARMARLEMAATRLASGRLDTRVKVESGDFLGRVGMAFNGMASQVQSLLRAQQDMIRAVSHELRTPVARIRFAVQMVEDMSEDALVRRQLQGVDSDIDELDDLIDEILTYARLDSETIHGVEASPEPVELRDICERVIDSLMPLHGNLDVRLSAGPEIEVHADSRYLQRATQNLVANACRHARTRVKVSLHDEPNQVRVDVEDDGEGVPPEARQDIFKPFARLDDSRTRRSGGYGLGLSIVQKVMAWHGGTVSVDESPGLKGARFSLIIPRRV